MHIRLEKNRADILGIKDDLPLVQHRHGGIFAHVGTNWSSFGLAALPDQPVGQVFRIDGVFVGVTQNRRRFRAGPASPGAFPAAICQSVQLFGRELPQPGVMINSSGAPCRTPAFLPPARCACCDP